MNKETLKEIENLKVDLEQLKEDLENYDESEAFDQMLDETTEHIFNMYPSNVLKNCDPIMYNEELSNYEDEGRSDLENQISDLEDEIEQLKEEEGE